MAAAPSTKEASKGREEQRHHDAGERATARASPPVNIRTLHRERWTRLSRHCGRAIGESWSDRSSAGLWFRRWCLNGRAQALRNQAARKPESLRGASPAAADRPSETSFGRTYAVGGEFFGARR